MSSSTLNGNARPFEPPGGVQSYDGGHGDAPAYTQQYQPPPQTPGRGGRGSRGGGGNYQQQQPNYAGHYAPPQVQHPYYPDGPQQHGSYSGPPPNPRPRPTQQQMNANSGGYGHSIGGPMPPGQGVPQRGRGGANSGYFNQQQQQQQHHMGMQQQHGGVPPPAGMGQPGQHLPHGGHMPRGMPQPQPPQQPSGYSTPHHQGAPGYLPDPPHAGYNDPTQGPHTPGLPSPGQSPMPQSHQQHVVPQSHPQQQQRAPPQQRMTPAAAPSYMRENGPKVIMVAGYRRSGKTSVAQEIARERGYEYISLAPAKVHDAAKAEEAAAAKTEEAADAKAEDEEEEDEEYDSLAERFAPLSTLLARKAELKGIVIDDALIYNKFEPYYVEFMLRKAGLRLDFLVIITTELASLVERGVKFGSDKSMKAHPESFEFGSWLEANNTSDSGLSPIAAIDGECELEMVVKDAVGQLKEVEARNLPSLTLPEVDFIPNCSLVSDPQLVDSILAAERAALGLEKLDYGFPYAEPNYLMDYVLFARNALLFKSYQIVPWIWGDKVSVIGYGDHVYVHLPSYQVVFHLKDVSPQMKDMIAHLKADVDASGAVPVDSRGPACLFSLEATMLNSAIHVSDMMVMGSHKGCRMILPERIAMMKELLGPLPPNGPVRLLQHFSVREITKCLKTYADIARGVLFVNPDGMQAGSYDSRNFIYPSEDVKTVKLRIWGGRIEGETWVFDALAQNSGEDIQVQNEDGSDMLVYISNEDVDKYTVNDGDIIECIEEHSGGATGNPKSGKKPAKPQAVSSHFAFQRRCVWQVAPTTLFYQSAFLSQPAWPTPLFLEACGSIRYEAPASPA